MAALFTFAAVAEVEDGALHAVGDIAERLEVLGEVGHEAELGSLERRMRWLAGCRRNREY